MYGYLHLVPISVVANPDHAETRFSRSVKDSDDISGAEFSVESGEQCAAHADVAGVSFLSKALALRVNPPDHKDEVEVRAGFVPAVEAAKNSHGSFLTLAPR